jgi:hypothetical protein
MDTCRVGVTFAVGAEVSKIGFGGGIEGAA